jgi:predicted phage-related endonuclease
MKILKMQQGSPEWLAARRAYDTASEASIMMACSKNVTRNELLHMKTTGTDREFTEWFQKNILDRGHEVEALGRPIAEKIVGEELFPITAIDDWGWLLASFDGITLLADICWECKQWNEEKAADVRDGRVPECDKWQVAQQLRVSGADKCLYMVTDGTEERTVYVWVTLTKEDDRMLAAGWRQFDADRLNYQHVEYAPKPEGKTPDALPALRIELTGAVSASNLSEFREIALAAINKVSTELQTDEDFASAENGVKWCKDVETRLAAAKDHALSQTQTIDELFRTIDSISAEARQKRLDLEKLVKSRKESIKSDILSTSRQEFSDYTRKLSVAKYMPAINADFAGVMKGKRTISSLQSACDDEMARVKIEANEIAETIHANLQQLNGHANDYKFLFNDFGHICQKPAEDFAAIVKSRIADHKEAEQARLDAERAKIRAEEEVKARREAEQKAAADRQAEQKQADDARYAAEQEAMKAKQQEQIERQAAEAEVVKAAVVDEPVQQKPVQASAPARPAKSRPPLEQMARVLANYYSVTPFTAMEWMAEALAQEAA